MEDGGGVFDGLDWGEGSGVLGGGEETVEGVFEGDVEVGEGLNGVEVYEWWLLAWISIGIDDIIV